MKAFTGFAAAALVLALFGGAPARAQGLPAAAPESVGLSKERLDRFKTLIEQRIGEDKLAGAVVLVARRGKLAYFETFGLMDKATARPMAKDAIFRLYSMTKPIIAVAAMELYEEGKFDLRDPVSAYLPEFAAMKVAVTKTDPATGKPRTSLVPAARPITILDLLRHTSGLGYYATKDDKGKPFYEPYGINRPDLDLAEWVKALAKAPLIHQPGTTFEYSYSIDVVGRLIEIWSGQPLEQFLAARVFTPLHMPDTGFFVPPEKHDRLATLYSPDPIGAVDDEGIRALGGPIVPVVGGQAIAFDQNPRHPSGGGGLVSTTMDYGRFLQMLANGGELDGVRLLSPKTVDLIGTDVLGDLAQGGGAPWTGDGFGLTMEISRGPGPTGTLSTRGSYDWGGLASTQMFVDPQEKLVGVLMTQVLPSSPYWGRMLRQLATQAIVEEEPK